MPTPPIDEIVDDEVTSVGPITIDLSTETQIFKLYVANCSDAYPLNANIVANPLAGCVELFAKYLAATLPIVSKNPEFLETCKKLDIKFRIVNS